MESFCETLSAEWRIFFLRQSEGLIYSTEASSQRISHSKPHSAVLRSRDLSYLAIERRTDPATKATRALTTEARRATGTTPLFGFRSLPSGSTDSIRSIPQPTFSSGVRYNLKIGPLYSARLFSRFAPFIIVLDYLSSLFWVQLVRIDGDWRRDSVCRLRSGLSLSFLCESSYQAIQIIMGDRSKRRRRKEWRR